MDYKTLFDAGAYSVCGQIDFKGKNIGRCTETGPELTPEGRKYFESCMAESVAPVAAEPAAEPAPKPAAKRAKKAVVEAPVEDLAVDIGDLDALLGK